MRSLRRPVSETGHPPFAPPRTLSQVPAPSPGIEPSELRSALGAAGTFDVLEEAEVEVREGKFHTGLGAVVRVLWRKGEA